MKYKAIGDKVIIKKDKLDNERSFQTKSGIKVINTENARFKGRLSLGTVESVGSSYKNEHGQLVNISDLLKVGDKVLYYHPAEFVIDGDLIAIRAIDIDAIVEASDSEIITLRS